MKRLPDVNIHIDKFLVRLWLVLLLSAAGSLADVAEFALRSDSSSGTVGGYWAILGLICLAVFKATALTAIYAVCRRNRWAKAGAILMIAAFMVLSLINGFCWLFYGFGISMKLLKIIMETNPTELGEFIPELTDKLIGLLHLPWLWFGLVVFLSLWKWLPAISGKWLLSVSIGISVLGLAYFIYVFSVAEFGRNTHSVFVRSGKCVMKYITDFRRIQELQSKKQPLACLESLKSTHAAERIVVVIGESASRGHLSLYGYPLPTTPRMDSMRDDLFVFTDAVASSSSTAENMPRLLTLMTDEPDGGEWYTYPSMLQIFKELGYRTYWLSNQEYSGQWSNLSSILSSDADVLRYVGSMDSDDHYLYRYDDALLPEWDNANSANDSLQLTFLHLMGSHFQYDRRFPEDRHHFSAKDVMAKMKRPWLDDKKAGIIANYDNSILYTDSILSLMINDVKEQKQPTVLIYLSDHGEDVYDDRDYRGRNEKFTEVPFLIYTNEAYRMRNPEIINELLAAGSVSFSTSELPQIVMHLSGTRYEMYDSVRDPLSTAFKTRKRWVDEEVFYRDER